MIYSTEKHKQANHKQIFFEITENSIPDTDINWFREYLDSSMLEGSQFKEGQTIQLGSYLIKLETIDNKLTLLEPELKGNVFNFVPGVNNTLRILRNQKDVVESIKMDGLLPDFADMAQPIIVSGDYKNSHLFNITHEAPTETDSGWFFADKNNESDTKMISIFEFFTARPELIQFFAIPQGTSIFKVESGEIIPVKDGNQIETKDGSYLSELNKVITTNSSDVIKVEPGPKGFKKFLAKIFGKKDSA
ncbi:MAG: hypothetical protein HRU38_17380 [Saccharospirillaceae bacterium]|nr:hypothetical protein [Pseudomonadales bacterium]NRB80411.1 hypothetical protein [Saccharospirillaceae bacterium]